MSIGPGRELARSTVTARVAVGAASTVITYGLI
jgi:hypothetical protein